MIFSTSRTSSLTSTDIEIPDNKIIFTLKSFSINLKISISSLLSKSPFVFDLKTLFKIFFGKE